MPAKVAPKAKPKTVPAKTSQPSTDRHIAVVIAHAEIQDGKVTLLPNKVGPIRVTPGQTLHVKLTYRLQEASKEKEEYRFHLRCNLDGQSPAPVLARHGDAWGIPDDVMGAIVQTFTPPKRPGNHNLEFQAGAEIQESLTTTWPRRLSRMAERLSDRIETLLAVRRCCWWRFRSIGSSQRPTSAILPTHT
jgi:hypothetical protein